MTFLTIYLIGVLLCILYCIVITYRHGELTIIDIALYNVFTLSSWLGILAFLSLYIIENWDKVVWKRKDGNNE